MERDTIIQRFSSMVGPQNSTEPQDQTAPSEKDPEFKNLQRRERAAAVATFPCSRNLDDIYRERYQRLR
jgi:hypothetical protein